MVQEFSDGVLRAAAEIYEQQVRGPFARLLAEGLVRLTEREMVTFLSKWAIDDNGGEGWLYRAAFAHLDTHSIDLLDLKVLPLGNSALELPAEFEGVLVSESLSRALQDQLDAAFEDALERFDAPCVPASEYRGVWIMLDELTPQRIHDDMMADEQTVNAALNLFGTNAADAIHFLQALSLSLGDLAEKLATTTDARPETPSS